MSDDLTDAQRDELHAALMALLVELEEALSRTSASSKAVDLDEPIGRISRVDALQQQEMAKAQRARQQIRFAQVNAALRAMTEGDYGECALCDDPIPYARLQVRPESPMCMECQSSRESRR